ncbi:DUF551 domain-containing protein [Providencia stuartii]|uniref:DUF551 domain-containing protein n=1 Tax=Providencia stuartii TaxID=588 RepID=UPI0013D27713|nr:DUF551 domain-containing protein [Providencia stuartii]HEM6842519.1 DUF551 domain-containing protein [Providencia stuartii]
MQGTNPTEFEKWCAKEMGLTESYVKSNRKINTFGMLQYRNAEIEKRFMAYKAGLISGASIGCSHAKVQGTNWVNRNERTPDEDGKYFTFGSHGRTTAWWKGDIQKFQNAESGENEGMQDMDGEVYIVTHWMNLPEKPEPPMPEGE